MTKESTKNPAAELVDLYCGKLERTQPTRQVVQQVAGSVLKEYMDLCVALTTDSAPENRQNKAVEYLGRLHKLRLQSPNPGSLPELRRDILDWLKNRDDLGRRLNQIIADREEPSIEDESSLPRQRP